MTTSAFIGIGTSFERLEGSTWTAVSEITNINGPQVTRDTVEATTLDSTAGFREFISGLRDGGNVTLNMNFTAAGYDLLNGDLMTDTVQTYRVVLPDEVYTFTFNAFVTELAMGDISPDDRVQADCTLKITGEVEVPSV